MTPQPKLQTILITGSRNWNDVDTIRNAIWKRIGTYDLVDGKILSEEDAKLHRIVEGGAKGADTIARTIALELGIEVITVVADWEKYGRKAGPVRNLKMLTEYCPDCILAFPRKESRGTIHCICEAIKLQIPVEIYYEHRH